MQAEKSTEFKKWAEEKDNEWEEAMIYATKKNNKKYKKLMFKLMFFQAMIALEERVAVEIFRLQRAEILKQICLCEISNPHNLEESQPSPSLNCEQKEGKTTRQKRKLSERKGKTKKKCKIELSNNTNQNQKRKRKILKEKRKQYKKNQDPMNANVVKKSNGVT